MLKIESVKCRLPRPGETAVCAVSGGLDSMCLLDILYKYNYNKYKYKYNQKGEFDLIAAHFNHGLRRNANRDETFVRDWCAERDIKFISGYENVKAFAEREKLSVEEAARIARYEFLRRVARENQADWIYTAHHLDDNAETVLLNLIRGTGIRGLSGMRDYHDGICRPLLDITREDLRAYAELNNIKYIDDESNFDPDAAARNFLRLNIMPLLKEINIKAAEHIHNAAKQLNIIDQSLESDARERVSGMEIDNGRVILPVKSFMDAGGAVRPRMILYALDQLGIGRKDIGTAHLNAIEEVYIHPARTDGGRERRLSLPRGVTVRCQRDRMIFETTPRKPTEIELQPGKNLTWGAYRLLLYDDDGTNNNIDIIDINNNNININQNDSGLILKGPKRDQYGGLIGRDLITVAPCQPGERLFLPGTNGSRSIKRLCLDKKIDLSERDGLPAIYINGVLAAVWRLGTDVAFLPENAPRRFVRVEKIK